MKYVFLLLATLLLTACQSKKTADATSSADSTASTQTAPASAPLTARLQTLGLTDAAHWRGISLGDPVQTVRSTEKAELFEEDADHLGYSIDFPNVESMDMLYRQRNGRVTGIDADLYLNSAANVKAHQQDLTAYFNGKYKPTTPGSWTGPQGERVTIRDVSKGKDFGLKVQFAAAGNVAP